MQLTPNYNLKKPEGTDPVDIQDFNDNADILDAELNKKADSAGGDISNMTIKALEEPTGTQFPVPEAGETSKSFLGKIRKFMNDFKSWNTGVCMIGQIVNNCVTNNDKLPLSAAQGKVLMDLYSVLNTNLTTMWNSGLTYGANFDFKTGGYLKVGNLVIVALSLNIKSDIAETSYVDAVLDLPLPIVEAALAVWTFNTAAANLNKCRIMPYNNGGLVYVYGALSKGEELQISGAYISAK